MLHAGSCAAHMQELQLPLTCNLACFLPPGFLTITPEGAYTLSLFQASAKRDGTQATLTFAAGIDPAALQNGELIGLLLPVTPTPQLTSCSRCNSSL